MFTFSVHNFSFVYVGYARTTENATLCDDVVTSGLDCEQSLFFFGIAEGSAQFAIARLRAARNEGGLAPSFLSALQLAARLPTLDLMILNLLGGVF